MEANFWSCVCVDEIIRYEEVTQKTQLQLWKAEKYQVINETLNQFNKQGDDKGFRDKVNLGH